MTVIVSVKINDGVVMASDSASTFGNGQVYHNADKIFNLVKGLPIGVMVTGAGGIGSESIATLMKDLRSRLDGSIGHDWTLDQSQYTIKGAAEYVRSFLFDEKVTLQGIETWMRLRVCGYSAGRPSSEIWNLSIAGLHCEEPQLIKAEDDFGPNWDGEYEALDRLILGIGNRTAEALVAAGYENEKAQEICRTIYSSERALLALPAMPIQDAIDLARFMVETTTNFVRFSATMQPKTVGGPVEIATITKHEGFKWIQRKHFYSPTFNP